MELPDVVTFPLVLESELDVGAALPLLALLVALPEDDEDIVFVFDVADEGGVATGSARRASCDGAGYGLA